MNRHLSACAQLVILSGLAICRGQSPAPTPQNEKPNEKPKIKTVRVYAESRTLADKSGNANTGSLYKFNRITNDFESGDLRAGAQMAIAGSRVLLSGTLFISASPVPSCATRDWTITTLADETAGVIIYRPGDVSVYCDSPIDQNEDADPYNSRKTPAKQLQALLDFLASKAKPKNPPAADGDAYLYAVIPVDADWIELTGYLGRLNDPARKKPGSLSPTDCWVRQGKDSYKAASVLSTELYPCDLAEKDQSWLNNSFYHSGWIYNRLTSPAVWAGTVSLAPEVIGGKPQSLTEDVIFSGSSKEGPGWAGLNTQLEKSSTTTSNLNALDAALTYDLRLAPTTKKWWYSPFKEKGSVDGPSLEPKTKLGLGVRPGELILSSGEEYADTRPTRVDLPTGPLKKDLNLVEGIYYRQPISFAALKFPSMITVFPVVGAEGGWHLIHYLPERSQFFRGVAGLDASLRWPYQLAPNFTSTKPATIDFTFRERIPISDEPYTNLAGTTPMPQLTQRGRQYMRLALNWPISGFVAITTAVQHGSLPPNFTAIGWTLSVGLTFSNPGTVEH